MTEGRRKGGDGENVLERRRWRGGAGTGSDWRGGVEELERWSLRGGAGVEALESTELDFTGCGWTRLSDGQPYDKNRTSSDGLRKYFECSSVCVCDSVSLCACVCVCVCKCV